MMDDKDSRNIIQAYTYLALLKEQLGQIRANLNGTFTKNSFIDNGYFNFAVALGNFNINKNKFLLIAPEKVADFYNSNFKSTYR